MNKALEALDRELKTIRTGRANPAILDRISADYYGTQTPIKNMANIGIVDGRTIEIKPFDKGALKAMEKAIQDSDLGLTPTNDGSRLLISIPDLTKERRQELAKLVKKQSEEAKVAMRNIRRDEMDEIKKIEAGSEDEKKKLQDDVQKITDDFIKKIDEMASAKEKEILTI
ncbi:MAG: ribosome recycling factor [Candidatus Caenarcaniphilales bacterium]|nr:ribosome recycling factor [Candidatus Caenarcaniphilales bacterium]